jgi:hypothetical protein
MVRRGWIFVSAHPADYTIIRAEMTGLDDEMKKSSPADWHLKNSFL